MEGDDRRGWQCCDLAAVVADGRLHEDNQRTRLGEAAASTAGTTAVRGGAAAVAAAVAAVGPPLCSSLSSHLKWRMLLSFFK